LEQNLVHLAESAAWVFLIVFIFAAIGVVATIRWIIAQVTRGEQAVVSEATRSATRSPITEIGSSADGSLEQDRSKRTDFDEAGAFV